MMRRLDDKSIPDGTLMLHRVRVQHQFQTLALARFCQLEAQADFTIEQLADRIAYKARDVRALLGGTRPWTIENASDIFLGMACELRLSARPLWQPTWWRRLLHWWHTAALPTIQGWNPCNE
jgi:hypothetical protein